ncbi:trypsin-like peptidase domain-containing protein [Streptomyces sp. S1A]|uniref:nSTAND1 domain-containing NTPase n=1 Tax=Streptomyces sp. ICN903 TaxID=2964654 RepID=UPI001EDAED9A|nr:trypsin-like peptidase domain-containing protein [Streptomyces sp. ICN903]MCG3039933.1 trypsin-like peptidase domain-containing protein [Streptomyces sp. ICN903]
MSALRGEAALESGLGRIRGTGQVVGAGFLVAPDTVCTCAHVVADALGLPRDTETAPEGAVLVEFPLARDADGAVPALTGRVVSWQPVRDDDSGDVALLRLDAPLRHARPVPLVDGTSVWGHAFRAYGFPDGGDHGIWANGTLRAAQGAGWVQMDAGPGSPPVTNGFSGAAVWDDEQGGVVGLAVAAGHGALAGTAFLVPSAALVDERVLRPTCPFRGLEVFEEEDAAFFHGRDDDIERLTASIADRPLTVVVGPSGCGKSSLIRAGVLPRLRTGGTGVTLLRPVPGTAPHMLLAHALVPVLEPRAGEIDRLSRARELARLLEGVPGAVERVDGGRAPQAMTAVRASLEERTGPGGHLVVVDQLEEYADAAPSEARALLRLLLSLTGDPRGKGGRGLRVVATARQESLGTLLTSETSGSLSEAVVFLAPLDTADLHRAVTGPVDAVPGLWLEPGLAERITEDAGQAPGRMPMVEFTLTRLWERREGSMLTHAAYDDLGGVSGTVAGYAEEAYRRYVPETDEEVARRLFVQLARPDDQGGYARRAVPVDGLDPAAVVLARRLARGKLVVVDRTLDGTEIVDLVHEALTRLWPRLRAWLDESRDFREWQEQLRADLARWETKNREAGALQRGKTLAEALEWLQSRPHDVTADERAYIETGRRYEQRTVRRLRAGGAVLLALLLVAGALGVAAWQSSREVQDQLRVLAARALADESGRRQAQEPAAAVQLALAAWRADPTAPQAREALLGQYVRAQYLRGMYTGLWRGRVQELVATPDARTLVLRSKPDGKDPYELTVVTGALDGRPRHHTLAGAPRTGQRGAVSADGRHYAAAMPDGTVRLWRLGTAGGAPKRLGERLTEEGDIVGAQLDFSADGTRLLRYLDIHTPGRPGARPKAVLDVWEIDGLESVPVADSVVSTAGEQIVRFGTDADTVEVTTSHSEDTDTPDGSVLRDLRTARVLRELPYDDDSSERLALDDATGAYHYGSWDSSDGGFVDVALVRRGTDDTYATRLPLDDEPGYSSVELAVGRGGDGGLAVLSPVGDTLVVARASAAPPPARNAQITLSVLSPDGRRVARLTDRGLEVLDLVHGGTATGDLPAAYAEGADPELVWTPDGDRLVLFKEGGTHLHVYGADTLSEHVDVELDPDGTAGGDHGLISTVEPLPDGDVAVLTRTGRLLTVDPRRGVLTARPLTIEGSPRPRPSVWTRDQLAARPGHPRQVAVVASNDRQRGRIQIWDVRARTRTHELEGDEVDAVLQQKGTDNLAFSPDGRYLVVAHNDGRLHRWDVEDRETVGGPVVLQTSDHLVGMTDDGVVITAEGYGGYELWDPDGVRIGAIPHHSYSSSALRGTRLVLESEGLRSVFDVRPKAWFDHLCANVGRAFTEEEREDLPPGTPPEPPCQGLSGRS